MTTPTLSEKHFEALEYAKRVFDSHAEACVGDAYHSAVRDALLLAELPDRISASQERIAELESGIEAANRTATQLIQENSALAAENAELKEIARLIGSIFFYGGFKAETYNEKKLETLLRKIGFLFENESQVITEEQATPPQAPAVGDDEAIRAGFEKCYAKETARRGRTLNRNNDGGYCNMKVADDFEFYRQAWNDSAAKYRASVAGAEPVAWKYRYHDTYPGIWHVAEGDPRKAHGAGISDAIPLYAAPAPAQGAVADAATVISALEDYLLEIDSSSCRAGVLAEQVYEWVNENLPVLLTQGASR